MSSCGTEMLATTGQQAQAAVLMVGYGNLLRSDDGIGPAVVSRLAASFYDEPKCVFAVPHQLMPEVAEQVAEAQRVIFVDASVALAPGKVAIRRAWGSGARRCSMGHAMTPEMVLALAEGMYGKCPEAWVVCVGVWNMRVGDKLSPRVSNAAGRLVRHLAHRIRKWSQQASSCGASKEVSS